MQDEELTRDQRIQSDFAKVCHLTKLIYGAEIVFTTLGFVLVFGTFIFKINNLFFYGFSSAVFAFVVCAYLCWLFYRCPNCWTPLLVPGGPWRGGNRPDFTVTDCPNCGAHLQSR